jgi:hypothetical protein
MFVNIDFDSLNPKNIPKTTLQRSLWRNFPRA